MHEQEDSSVPGSVAEGGRQPDPHGGDDTRERLMRAGGVEFGRRGFFDASVRAICANAGANVSAVKYHFGSKEGLYRAVVTAGREQMSGGVELPRMRDDEDPAFALERWMRWFLGMMLVTETDHPWFGEILSHEMIHPTVCLDEFVEHTAGPMRAEVIRIISRIVPEGAGQIELGRLANALIGMCACQKHAKQMLTRFGSPPPRTQGEIDALASTLTRFAVQGLGGFTPGEDGA